jgi:hypothetical protein
MPGCRVSQLLRGLGVVAVLVAVGPPAAEAARPNVRVEVLSVQAALAPDGRSISFDIETTCDRKATIVDARVSVVQASGSGEGPFTPNCVQIPNVVRVSVPVVQGSFLTGDAQVSAFLAVRQGSTKRAQDSAAVRVRPSVDVRAADQAVLEGGGAAVRIDVTVTCPMISAGQGGQITVFQFPVGGRATFGPTACDGVPHTQSVRVPASGGLFRAGTAEIEAFASIVEGGDIFPGSDIRTIQIVSP